MINKVVKKPIETHIYRHANTNKAFVVKELSNYDWKRWKAMHAVITVYCWQGPILWSNQLLWYFMKVAPTCLFLLSAGGVHLHCEMVLAKW